MPSFSSIQVTPAMRRRLARYKRAGMSYEDVLVVLLDAIPPEDFRARWDRADAASRQEIRAVGRRDPAAATIEARAAEDARIAALSPAERMEEAYRLSVMFRSRV